MQSRAEDLMIDQSLAQSRMYFQLLHLLRIIPLWIRETRADLEGLRASYNQIEPQETSRLIYRYRLTKHALDKSDEIIQKNWETLFEDFGRLEDMLHKRIEAKTDEIRGLRDGVSCN